MVNGAAFWLIDEIAFQQYHPRVRTEQFQVWTLTVNLNEGTGTLLVKTAMAGCFAHSRFPTPASHWQKLRSILQMMLSCFQVRIKRQWPHTY